MKEPVLQEIAISQGKTAAQVAHRDAIQTAKAVASLDQFSKGRFLFGIGPGWNRDEMENYGVVFNSRMDIMAEKVAAMREIWT